MALLEVRNLRTSFWTRHGEVRAVDDVSFDLAAGETLGLVGESGCGKSATATSLMRLLPPAPAATSSGEIIFNGKNLLDLSEKEMRRLRGNDIAMVFQDPMTSLNPVMPIGRQIGETLELHRRTTRRQTRERTVELLELVGIPAAAERLGDYPHQFSGGMRQRVMIAMALACEPKIVLADEITTALDVTIQAQILELLRDLAERLGTAFVLITHDLGVVARMAHRVNVMYAGRIVEKAPTGAIFDNPQMPYTWGLLQSIPRLEETRRERLIPIEGQPPDLAKPMPGCRFEPRCPYRREICGQREPDLRPVEPGQPEHETRCWGTQLVDGGGWLRGAQRPALTANYQRAA
ncbi:ABC transporter ATP-binding protein [Dactylosporangium sp. NPDC050688]|uniref:ABC transporter ATP-binding protein n=1 Tax=Dactylosporangium sp. NPDC050688 TaxID=3157217 RepID=UPI0034107A22